jgi:hypothetical protein
MLARAANLATGSCAARHPALHRRLTGTRSLLFLVKIKFPVTAQPEILQEGLTHTNSHK